MSVFTIEHYAAKASLHKALNEAEQRVTTGIPPEEVMVKLGSELDLFVEVGQRWGVTLQYKEKILKLFRELRFKATPRLHRLVAGRNGCRLHSDVGPRALLSPGPEEQLKRIDEAKRLREEVLLEQNDEDTLKKFRGEVSLSPMSRILIVPFRR